MATPIPSSADLARYMEARGEMAKPWVWHLLRLSKLQESKDSLAPDEYIERLGEAHADLMRLGELLERAGSGGVRGPLPALRGDRAPAGLPGRPMNGSSVCHRYPMAPLIRFTLLTLYLALVLPLPVLAPLALQLPLLVAVPVRAGPGPGNHQ